MIINKNNSFIHITAFCVIKKETDDEKFVCKIGSGEQ